jgi:hypothetical protein
MVVMALGVAIALGCVGLLAVDGATGNGERLSVKGSVRTAPTSSTETTYALVPVTGGAAQPTTTVAPPPKPPPPAPDPAATGGTFPPPTSAPTTTSTAPLPAPLTGDGAILQKPANPDQTRSIDKAKGCNSAGDAGWKIVECGALKRDDFTILWVVESKGGGSRALVLKERTPGQWATVLSAADDNGSRYSRIGVHGEDVSGDGRAELVFGFHRRTGDKGTGVDVVDAPVAVTLHRDLTGPTTSVRAGADPALHTWASQADGTSLHQVIKVIGGAWRLAAQETVARSAVPASMV